MILKNTINTYGSLAKCLHWLLFFLITGMLVMGFCFDLLPESIKAFSFKMHKLTGLAILALMLFRFVWMLINPKPVLPPGTPWYERAAERAGHWCIYLAVRAMPIAGWIGSVAAGRAPTLGSIAISLPIAKDKALSGNAFDVHNTLAFIIIALLVGHVLAALFHHYIRKDNVLKRMLP